MNVSQTSHDIMTADDPIFELRGVNVAFEMDRGQARVVDDLNVDVERNEILGVVGESGSGKSMFASAFMNAVVDPGVTTGQVTYHPRDGEPFDVLQLSKKELKEFRWEEVAMVFQGAMSSFNPVRTIESHFVETLSSHDYNVKQGLERARELLADLYLEPERVLESYPHELSGGMKQRALMALSLILDPEVLIMDEPTAALDLLMQRSIISMINDIQEVQDLTIVFITHDLPLVAGLADRLAVMYSFDIVERGPAEDILSDAAHPYTRSLLNSTPNLTTPVERMRPVEGKSPDPVDVPSGCSFHPRCPLADELCRDYDPEPYTIENNHSAKCHHWEESRETINDALHAADDNAGGDTVIRAEQSDDVVVSLEDVEVHFEEDTGGFLNFFSEPDVVRAVDDVSLDVYQNEVVVLVGESGCGKTTLGKTAIGLEEPTSGRVIYREQDIWEAKNLVDDNIEIPWEEIRRSLQIVHQDPGSALNSYKTVESILKTPLNRWYPELDGKDRRARILGMLDYVGMTPADDYIERYPFQLSGGEMQRVALIRALMMNPELILADEAVSALDVSLRVEMMDLMLELQEEFNTSYLFISHDLSNARYIAEKAGGRIGVMYLGQIVEIGTPGQIINDPRHPYTQALRWATTELDTNEGDATEPPMRGIDIPDPVNPPDGCRYHTRCPEAREVCRNQQPALMQGDEGIRETACFREDDDHEYWQSESIVDE